MKNITEVKDGEEIQLSIEYYDLQVKYMGQKVESWKSNVKRVLGIDPDEAYKRIRPYRREFNMLLSCAGALLAKIKK